MVIVIMTMKQFKKLKIIKFLRNLQISVDDIKAILDGELDFRHCLKIKSSEHAKNK